MPVFLAFVIVFAGHWAHIKSGQDCSPPIQTLLYPECSNPGRVVDPPRVEPYPVPAILMPEPVRWNDPELTRRVLAPGAIWWDR